MLPPGRPTLHIAAKLAANIAAMCTAPAERLRRDDSRPHAARRAPMWNARSPKDRPESAAAPGPAFSPFSFPPLGTPFPDSPFKSGLHQRGQTAGGNRTAAFLENGAKPPRSRRFSLAPFSAAALRVAPPHRRSINPVALDPTLGVSALVGPKPVAAVQVLARFRPSKVAPIAKRIGALILPPKTLRGGFALRAPATRRASDPATVTPSRCGIGMSCRLRTARRGCGQLFLSAAKW